LMVLDEVFHVGEGSFLVNGLWGFPGSHESGNGDNAHTEEGEDTETFSLSSLGLVVE
jgi:hypothetical protein